MAVLTLINNYKYASNIFQSWAQVFYQCNTFGKSIIRRHLKNVRGKAVGEF